jgi:hypothetical protein
LSKGSRTSVSKKQFQALHAHFGISYSTASKLVKVGNSQRITEIEKNCAVWGWMPGRRYMRVVKLDEADFEKFSADFLSGDEPKHS